MRMWKRTGIALLSGLLGIQMFFGTPFAMAEESGYEQLQKENGGQLAQRHRFIFTTEQAVIFTFGGLSKKAPLQAILENMQENNMRGTFFVTERELERNGENISMIRSYGQDLGIGLTSVKDGDFASYCAQIERIREKLQERYGVDTRIVRQISGGVDEKPILEAVQAMGCMLVGQGLNVVQSKHKDAETADEIMSQIFGRWTTSLNRGEVVYIRTDFYTRDEIVPELMLRIKRDKVDNIAYRSTMDEPETNPANNSAYHIASVQDVLEHGEKLWNYPVDTASLPKEMQPEYGCDQITKENFQQVFLDRYIGAPQVLKGNRMLDFTYREMEKADKTGLVKTVTDNTIFLTFDDWGQDESINKLLYVLRKHQAKGTFFIITWNVGNNPNLLRAIAEEGQEIGSHTNKHKPMALENEKGKQVPGMPIDEYREDVRSAYRILAETVGDMTIEGRRPALTRFLRPPTLAISRGGCEEILNAGYTYIVNGYGSTEDYGAVSLQSLVGIMNSIVHKEDGTVRKGSIVIMHMSSTASKTARALDILLTANERLPDGDPRKFKTAFLGDYLKDGYSQRMKMPKENR